MPKKNFFPKKHLHLHLVLPPFPFLMMLRSLSAVSLFPPPGLSTFPLDHTRKSCSRMSHWPERHTPIFALLAPTTRRTSTKTSPPQRTCCDQLDRERLDSLVTFNSNLFLSIMPMIKICNFSVSHSFHLCISLFMRTGTIINHPMSSPVFVTKLTINKHLLNAKIIGSTGHFL